MSLISELYLFEFNFDLIKNTLKKNKITIYKEYSLLKTTPSLLGNIFNYGIWNLSYSEYKQKKYNLPIMKVWTGR
jgi:hypothetical protein